MTELMRIGVLIVQIYIPTWKHVEGEVEELYGVIA